MANPTHDFDPADNAFQDGRYLRVGLHELADGTFVNVSPATPIPSGLTDANGNVLTTYVTASGVVALDIHNADVHSQIVNTDMHQHSATTTTLTVATTGDGSENTITVASTVGFVVGDSCHINTSAEETTHPVILNITGSVFTLDRYIDFAHIVGDEVIKSILDMSSQVGSLVTPQEYFIEPPAGQVWHITRLLFEMTHAIAGDLGKFGGIAALVNGIILRAKINGQYGTLTNWKNNGDIKTDMFDVVFDARSGGQGDFGTSGRGTFTETGAIVRLDGDTNDRIELYVQDDITGLERFTMKMQGHLEAPAN